MGLKLFEQVHTHLDARSVRIAIGTIVEATILSAPSSMKAALIDVMGGKIDVAFPAIGAAIPNQDTAIEFVKSGLISVELPWHGLASQWGGELLRCWSLS